MKPSTQPCLCLHLWPILSDVVDGGYALADCLSVSGICSVHLIGALLALPEAHMSQQQTDGMLSFPESNTVNPEQPGDQRPVAQPEHVEPGATQRNPPPSNLSDFLIGAQISH